MVFVIKCTSRWMFWLYVWGQLSSCTTTCARNWTKNKRNEMKNHFWQSPFIPLVAWGIENHPRRARDVGRRAKKMAHPFTWNHQIKLKKFICKNRNGSDFCIIHPFISFNRMYQRTSKILRTKFNVGTVLGASLGGDGADNPPDARPKKPKWVVARTQMKRIAEAAAF